jgi:hypothetical protein
MVGLKRLTRRAQRKEMEEFTMEFKIELHGVSRSFEEYGIGL